MPRLKPPNADAGAAAVVVAGCVEAVDDAAGPGKFMLPKRFDPVFVVAEGGALEVAGAF